MTIPSPSLSHIDFWDVGQGDCSVLNFSDQSVLLIDTGDKRSPIVDWLANTRKTIQALVLTHIDADHAGALCPILEANQHRINSVYFFDFDRRDDKFLNLFNCVRKARRTSAIKFERPQAGSILWQSISQQLELRVLYPDYAEQVEARTENSASALIGLYKKNELMITWPGDLTIAKIDEKLGAASMHLLVGPHHGGPEDRRNEQKERSIPFRPKNAFISVGSINRYRHPRAVYLKALVKAGCTVLCSELTYKCQPNLTSNRRPVLQGSALLGLPAHHSGVPCRGTFRLHFQNDEFVPDRFHAEHQRRIQALQQPLCLRGN
jgi:beta-lactamase superfamily II metal-dependent hydrolase